MTKLLSHNLKMECFRLTNNPISVVEVDCNQQLLTQHYKTNLVRDVACTTLLSVPLLIGVLAVIEGSNFTNAFLMMEEKSLISNFQSMPVLVFYAANFYCGLKNRFYHGLINYFKISTETERFFAPLPMLLMLLSLIISVYSLYNNLLNGGMPSVVNQICIQLTLFLTSLAMTINTTLDFLATRQARISQFYSMLINERLVYDPERVSAPSSKQG
ncbi:hypothetical protein ACFBZI_11110 [Moraxella sp. ZJ142]|uniref:hypothetical protein n=1 Tax=Moraxella marmotae TaxID=3344520 RepID=UPI0035D415FF